MTGQGHSLLFIKAVTLPECEEVHGMRKKRLFVLGCCLLSFATLIQASTDLPPSAKVELGPVEDVCSNFIGPEARKEQV
ncbi:MAG: hypothetical protein ABL933_19250, partial [Methyloglobulus sp.]